MVVREGRHAGRAFRGTLPTGGTGTMGTPASSARRRLLAPARAMGQDLERERHSADLRLRG